MFPFNRIRFPSSKGSVIRDCVAGLELPGRATCCWPACGDGQLCCVVPLFWPTATEPEVNKPAVKQIPITSERKRFTAVSFVLLMASQVVVLGRVVAPVRDLTLRRRYELMDYLSKSQLLTVVSSPPSTLGTVIVSA